uniref:Uncharacterized protein LOC104225491 n=1 Tax=Nicotiana sylvestris TaxID=4096 RepID=A0A1U7W6F3_NICSY|nr:PREDICTED: uncharacterized protein LOC104225491 [Nicotiana sylvestris]
MSGQTNTTRERWFLPWGKRKKNCKVESSNQEAIKKNRKIIREADKAAAHSTRSEYAPSRSLRDSPSPGRADVATSKKPVNVISDSSDEYGAEKANENTYSTSPTASLSGESRGYAEGGAPQVGGIERTRRPGAWEDRFVSELRDSPSPGRADVATSKKPVNVISDSSDEYGAEKANENTYSTSPTASLSGESRGYAEGGAPQVGGIERTRRPGAWEDRFVSEVAFHKFRKW